MTDIFEAGTIGHIVISVALMNSTISPSRHADIFANQFNKVPIKMIWIDMQFVKDNGIDCEYMK